MKAMGSPPPDADAIDSAYEAHSRDACRWSASGYCVLGIVVLLAAVPLDRVREEPVADPLLMLRFVGMLALALAFALLQSGLGRRHPRPLALLPPALAGALVHVLAVGSPGPAGAANVIAIFCILGMALLMAWPGIWSALASGLVIASYAGVAVLAHGAAAGAPSLETVLVLGATGAVAVGITAMLERTRRREFEQRWTLRAAHRDVRESAERYRSLVEIAPSAIIVLAADGRITEFNREAERVLGWPRETVIGRPSSILCGPVMGGAAIAVAVRRALLGQPTQGLEARLRSRGGEERVLVCNVRRVGDGQPGDVIVCGQDMSDRQRVEEALRQSETRLREVIASSPVVLFTLDRAGVVTLAEGRGLARLGLAPGELAGRSIHELVQMLTTNAAPTLAHFERTLSGEPVIWNGSLGEATFECRLTPLRDARGEVTGVLGLALDVTERTRAETARLALERTLREAQRLESLGVLAGGIAHDFNNLLVAVLGNVSLALAELPVEAPLRERLRRIETAARRGSDLIRRMLTFAGKGDVAPEPVEVNAVVEEMRDILRGTIPERVALQVELEAVPAVVADPTQVRQVVMNLLMNAGEAIGEQGGEIRLRTSVVNLDRDALGAMQHAAGAVPGPYVCLEVADTGCGMDEATVARIFDPFYSTKFPGRGLGLATVLGVVRGHRGALAVASRPGSGTTFRVYLPCGKLPPRTAAPAEAPRAVEVEAAARTVLLVDDEADVRAVTAHMLERLGCSVLQAGDGREGVEVFRAHAQRIDAVLLDLSLPRLSGDRACHEIRSIRPDARVILMSGYSDESTSHRFAEIGLAGFLRKPFSVADLRSTMDRALGC